MLWIIGKEPLKKSLLYLKLYHNVEFLLVNIAIFVYKPILRYLQVRIELPLREELFLYERDQPVKNPSLVPQGVVNKLKKGYRYNIQRTLQTLIPVILDSLQLHSLLAGLTQRVSLIQGPLGKIIRILLFLLPQILNRQYDLQVPVSHSQGPFQQRPFVIILKTESWLCAIRIMPWISSQKTYQILVQILPPL